MPRRRAPLTAARLARLPRFARPRFATSVALVLAASVGGVIACDAAPEAADNDVSQSDVSPAPGDGGSATGGDAQAEGASAGDAGTEIGDGGARDADPGYDDEEEEQGEPSDGGLSANFTDYAVNHVLVTGQSNAVGVGGASPITHTQPFSNLQFNTGIMPMSSCDADGCRSYQAPTSFAPLVQAEGYFSYPAETPTSGIADEITYLARQRFGFGVNDGAPSDHVVLTSVHARAGNTYACLRKGFCEYNRQRGHYAPFAQGVQEIEAAHSIAAAGGKSHVVRAVVTIHGESDHYAYASTHGHPEFPMPGTDGTPGKIRDYTDALLEWQEDYEAASKAATGQAEGVPLLLSATSGWTGVRTSAILDMQLEAHRRSAGKVIYVTPAYPFGVLNDCRHYSAHGERHIGEYFAKVYAKVIFGRQRWEPVHPRAISRQGRTITVRYHVPKPPLAFDTSLVVGAENMGFDVVDGAAFLPVQSVSLAGADTVQITLASDPSGGPLRLRYAQNQPTSGACIGNGLVYAPGARGNLRDSDDTPSYYGYKLYNWGANFDMPIP